MMHTAEKLAVLAVLTALTFGLPAALKADEDLDAPMQVGDSLAALDEGNIEVPALPKDPEVDESKLDEAEAAGFARIRDEFEYDDVDDSLTDELSDEGDFELDEQVDFDDFDDPQYPAGN